MKLIMKIIACILLFNAAFSVKIENAGERAKETMPDRRDVIPSNHRQERAEINVQGNNRKDLHKILNANSHYEFHVVRTVPVTQGRTKQRIEVTFDGIPVFGIGIQATYNEQNGYTGAVTGEFVSEIENDIPDSSACQRSDDFLFSLGKESFQIPSDCQKCKLLKTERIVYITDNNKARLAYSVTINDNSSAEQSVPYLIVDACNLKVYIKANKVEN